MLRWKMLQNLWLRSGDGCVFSCPALDGNWEGTPEVMGRQVAIDLVKTSWRELGSTELISVARAALTEAGG